MANDHFGYIGNRRIPYPNREYIESFENLAGGMNTMIRPVQLSGNESPFMRNMSWRNGALGCRRGQVKPGGSTSSTYQIPNETTSHFPINCVTSASFLYHGWTLVQADTGDPDDQPYVKFYAVKIQKVGESNEEDLGQVYEIVYNPPTGYTPRVTEPGCFFQYRDRVYFKANGLYIQFTHSSVEGYSTDQIAAMDLKIYVPTIIMNADPATGIGDKYQEENRLSPFKRIQYDVNAANLTTFYLPEIALPVDLDKVVVYTGDLDVTGGYTLYELNSTVSDGTTGRIELTSAVPQDSELFIQYDQPNEAAYNSIMFSSAAIVFGGNQDLCVVVGGTKEQPNAYFWSGLGKGDAIDPTYFPMNYYNLAGEVNAPITCFGKQQNMLVIFQPNAVGRAVFGIETIGGTSEETGKAVITMNYTRINAEIGCDMPGSLQLIENNLVWCNRKYGVCRLKDSSAAYENNIVVLSRKINNKGENGFDGLLSEFAPSSPSASIPVVYNGARSVDTGTRYILRVPGGHAYEWNYEISEWGNPSWFFHTDIGGVGFVPLENDTLYEVTWKGVVAEFQDGVFYDKLGDTEEPIGKEFWFPPRYLGGYDRLKNVMSAIFNTKSETDQNTTITYICDYSHRNDPTNIEVTAPTGTPMGQPYATISRRKPGYHNIRHLQIGLSNNEAGKDMNILSAYIYYTYRGRQR